MSAFKFPRYTLEIDEEGFPLFDGLRVHDATLSHQLLSRLKRALPGENRSPLVSVCDGEDIFIDAFSAPLVAQSVERRPDNPKLWHWRFVGDLSYSVSLSEILIDEWHRLHSWIGHEKIDALLSRKAQAQFYSLLDAEELANFAPQPFRKAKAPVENATFWTDAYKNKNDGWEMGMASPVLTKNFESLKKLLKPQSKILVPGAGRGHEAEFLSQQGFEVVAVDFAPEALEGHKKYYPRSQVKYLQEDIFKHLMQHQQHYDAVFEHTIFCAIDPAERKKFISCIAGALKPQGLYAGIFFLLCWPEGPPYGLTQWELRELSREKFEIYAWQRSKDSVPQRLGNEVWVILKLQSETESNTNR